MFDEENQDIEKLFYEKELLDDIDELDDDNSESEEDLEDEDIDLTVYKNTLIHETEQKVKRILQFVHKPTNKIFEGTVIGKDRENSDKFAFIVKQVNGDDHTEKTRIFNFNDLKNIRFKK